MPEHYFYFYDDVCSIVYKMKKMYRKYFILFLYYHVFNDFYCKYSLVLRLFSSKLYSM